MVVVSGGTASLYIPLILDVDERLWSVEYFRSNFDSIFSTNHRGQLFKCIIVVYGYSQRYYVLHSPAESFPSEASAPLLKILQSISGNSVASFASLSLQSRATFISRPPVAASFTPVEYTVCSSKHLEAMLYQSISSRLGTSEKMRPLLAITLTEKFRSDHHTTSSDGVPKSFYLLGLKEVHSLMGHMGLIFCFGIGSKYLGEVLIRWPLLRYNDSDKCLVSNLRFSYLLQLSGVTELFLGHGEFSPEASALFRSSALYRHSYHDVTTILEYLYLNMVLQRFQSKGPPVFFHASLAEQTLRSCNSLEASLSQAQQISSNPTDIMLSRHLNSHMAMALILLFAEKLQVSEISLSHHLRPQSWYVLNPLSQIVCFGSEHRIMNVKPDLDILSSLIRSIGILVGALFCSIQLLLGWSRIDISLGGLESQDGTSLRVLRMLVVVMDSLIRSIGILVGIHHNPSLVFCNWDFWLDLKLGGMDSKFGLLSFFHQLLWREFFVVMFSHDLKVTSLSDECSRLRESLMYALLIWKMVNPGRPQIVRRYISSLESQRFNSLIEKISTAITRTNCFLRAALHWSHFGKCVIHVIKHLDPIEGFCILGDYHRLSMSPEGLFLYLSFVIVSRLDYYCSVFWFEDATRLNVVKM